MRPKPTPNNQLISSQRQILEWLLTNYPRDVRRAINSQDAIEIVRAFHRYGWEATGPERAWAQRYGGDTILTPLGHLSLDAIKAGIDKINFADWLRNIEDRVYGKRNAGGDWGMENRTTPTTLREA
jgi:hypothetical protein